MDRELHSFCTLLPSFAILTSEPTSFRVHFFLKLLNLDETIRLNEDYLLGESMNLRPSIVVIGVLILGIGFSGCTRRDIKLTQGRIAAFQNPLDLHTAAHHWQAIKNGDGTVIEDYNETVGNAISQIAYRMLNRPGRPALKTLRGEIPLELDSSGIETPAHVDRVIPVESINVKRGLRSNIRVDGVGAPLVVRQRWTAQDPMVSKTGLWYPVTAVLDLDDPARPVMRFLDPTQEENTLVTVGQHQFPLQADYTASIARDLYDRQTQFVNLSGLIKYEKFSDHMGLFRISAFDPDKIPVVFVHGLKSTPNTWNDTLNEMMDDPVVRENYEFWTFGYPTGAPIPFLSAKLREEIGKMHSHRAQRGASRNRVTILAHSLGGVIAKPLTQSSGQKLWNQVFTVPPSQLDVPRSDRLLLRKMFILEPVEYIDKVIFIAVPHRGSPLANRAGKMTDLIIQAPNHLVKLTKKLVTANEDQMTPLGREVAGRVPTSVQQLNEDSAAIKLLSPLPLNPNVDYHSIMGNERDPRKIAEHLSSDGVVPYSSSHIEGVLSEKVCLGKHGIHKTPEAIAEIVRILHEHAGRAPASVSNMD